MRKNQYLNAKINQLNASFDRTKKLQKCTKSIGEGSMKCKLTFSPVRKIGNYYI